MSLRTRINCFTAWVNFRLMGTEGGVNNVITDLVAGSNMQHLVTGFVGYAPNRLGNMDGCTDQQKISRVEWAVRELKGNHVIDGDVQVNANLFAMHSADQIFPLLWRLVSYDIYHTWDRLEYLLLRDLQKSTEVPFTWVPQPPPARKKKPPVEMDAADAMLMGFGNSASAAQEVEYEPLPSDFKKFPGEEICVRYKSGKKHSRQRPSAEKCLLEMVNTQLGSTDEGQVQEITALTELADGHVMAALINSFLPDTFSTEILLKDRWGFHLALKTFESMTGLSTPVTAEDFANGDSMAIAAYMCPFFMLMFQAKQSCSVVKRLVEVRMNQRRAEQELEALYATVHVPTAASKEFETHKGKKDHWSALLRDSKQEEERILQLYDVRACERMLMRMKDVQVETRAVVRQKMKERFDLVMLPRPMTIAELVDAQMINLTLTRGAGFYRLTSKEPCSTERKLVLRERKTGRFISDVTSKTESISTKRMLGYPEHEMFECNPDKDSRYDVYIQAPSMNKSLKAGTMYMYQVFPGGLHLYESMLLKAVRTGEQTLARKLVIFFQGRPSFISCSEPSTGNTSLHLAARNGHEKLVLFLLEYGANIDAVNFTQCTPFYYAMSNAHKHCAQLLIEWGCDTWYKDHKGKTAWDSVRNEDIKGYLFDFYKYLSTHISPVVSGDTGVLRKLVNNHVVGTQPFASLRSRCIQGSTLLHTACHFGDKISIQTLLSEGLDVNVLDYKRATALHRAGTIESVEILLEAGADILIQDSEGNSPLHVICYGTKEEKSKLDCIELLIQRGSSVVAKNKKQLLPIHCAAMQGRIDVILHLMKVDGDRILLAIKDEEDCSSALSGGALTSQLAGPQDSSLTEMIDGSRAATDETELKSVSPNKLFGKKPKKPQPPSLLFLSLSNFYLECAETLKDLAFTFKSGEQHALMYKLLSSTTRPDNFRELLTFLLCNGADVGHQFEGGNSALHLTAANILFSDSMEILFNHDADVDQPNDQECTPLFLACQNDNPYAASVLLAQDADVRHKNLSGVTAFDLIDDLDGWMESGYFEPETMARLRAYSLKQSRDLVRSITRKIKGPQWNKKLRMIMAENSLELKASEKAGVVPPVGGTQPRGVVGEQTDARQVLIQAPGEKNEQIVRIPTSQILS